MFTGFDPENLEELARCGHAARAAVLETPLPAPVRDAVLAAYERLCERLGREPALGGSLVGHGRRSARGLVRRRRRDVPERARREALLRAVHACCASLFTDRAISYRARLGYDH